MVGGFVAGERRAVIREEYMADVTKDSSSEGAAIESASMRI